MKQDSGTGGFNNKQFCLTDITRHVQCRWGLTLQEELFTLLDFSKTYKKMCYRL